MKIKIRRLEARDWQAIANIYKLGLETENASFETEVPDFNTWDKKFRTDQRWVAVAGDKSLAGRASYPFRLEKFTKELLKSPSIYTLCILADELAHASCLI
jgi:L-amino acid N-acyltransferase YncA